MPRKKSKPAEATSRDPVISATAAVAEPASRPAYIDGPPVDKQGSIIAETETPQGRSMSGGKDGIAAQATKQVVSGLRPKWATGLEDAAKNWGDPYKAIVTTAMFEMGENRRFKQRVFKFKEKPADDVITALKENGFTYRAAEKAWTTHADADGRKVADDLAKRFRGTAQGMEL